MFKVFLLIGTILHSCIWFFIHKLPKVNYELY